jgi:hypothetical protein
VIPIILRPVYWKEAPFGKLKALPKHGKPLTDPDWQNLERALFNVADDIRKLVKKLLKKQERKTKDKSGRFYRLILIFAVLYYLYESIREGLFSYEPIPFIVWVFSEITSIVIFTIFCVVILSVLSVLAMIPIFMLYHHEDGIPSTPTPPKKGLMIILLSVIVIYLIFIIIFTIVFNPMSFLLSFLYPNFFKLIQNALQSNIGSLLSLLVIIVGAISALITIYEFTRRLIISKWRERTKLNRLISPPLTNEEKP